jgi:hypothetical protein
MFCAFGDGTATFEASAEEKDRKKRSTHLTRSALEPVRHKEMDMFWTASAPVRDQRFI